MEGVDGPLKVWIRRVWTLEMVSRLGPLRLSPFATMKTKLTPFSERDWPALIISICLPLWAEFAVVCPVISSESSCPVPLYVTCSVSFHWEKASLQFKAGSLRYLYSSVFP